MSCEVREFIVFGGGNTLLKAIERAEKNGVNLPIKYIVDNNKVLHGSELKGYPIYSPETLREENTKQTLVVACLDDGVIKQIKKQLEEMGINENFVVRSMQETFSPYIYENTQKVELYTCSIIFTTKCTMKCKHCSTMIPYIEEKRHIDVQEMKHWLDNYFSIVDHVRIINIYGGEPLVHPELKGVIELLLERKEHFDELVMTTNATVIPKDEVLEICRDNNIQFQISDYGNMHEMFVEEMEKWNIRYFIRPIDFWYELFNMDLNKEVDLAKETCAMCDYANYHTQLFENRVFLCPIVKGLHVAKREKYFSESDYFDLEKELGTNQNVKKEYLDFINKKRGCDYITACKHCYGTDLQHLVGVAEQA